MRRTKDGEAILLLLMGGGCYVRVVVESGHADGEGGHHHRPATHTEQA